MKQTLDALDLKILTTLHEGPRSTSELARMLAVDPQVIQRRCAALQHSRQLTGLDDRDLEILAALRQNDRLSTTELAERLTPSGRRKERERVYRHCVRLAEKAHLVHGKTAPGKRLLFYSPATGDVLNRSNYADIQETVKDLREIARQHPLPRRAQISLPVKESLRQEYRDYLHALAVRQPEERQRIEAFEAELMRVLQGTTLTDVVTMVNIRGFHLKERFWSLQESVRVWLDAGDWVSSGLIPGDVIWLDPTWEEPLRHAA